MSGEGQGKGGSERRGHALFGCGAGRVRTMLGDGRLGRNRLTCYGGDELFPRVTTMGSGTLPGTCPLGVYDVTAIRWPWILEQSSPLVGSVSAYPRLGLYDILDVDVDQVLILDQVHMIRIENP